MKERAAESDSNAMEADFYVAAETRSFEMMRIIGNIEQLGSWQVDKSVEMTKDQDGKRWHARISVPVDTAIKYRYFCCEYLYKTETDRRIIVSRFETHFHPRIYVKEENGYKNVDVFGTSGTSKASDNIFKLDKGWLTCQSEVRLSLRGADSLVFWDSSSSGNLSSNVLVTPIDFGNSFGQDPQLISRDINPGDDASVKFSNHGECFIGVLSDPNHANYDAQSKCGQKFEANDYLSFRVQTLEPDFLGFRFDLFSNVHPPSSAGVDEESFKRFGFCYLLPVANGDSLGRKTVPILSLDNRPIGTITVDYFVVYPLPQECGRKMDLSKSFVRYWKKRKALDVGHRGMGVSYKKTALVKENTIGSLNSAANFGADYVEFDVQLSKDLVPVLFHDFHLCLAVHQRDSEPDDYILHQICVNDLTLDDMNKLKVNDFLYLEKNLNIHHPKCLIESDEKSQKSFPMLNEVFLAVDPHLGFNIEIKYPMCTSDGVWESERRIERNLYVDKILEEVFKHATEDRRIVFSSFEPYICLMLKLKQNKYPVMFLTQGETKRYAPFTEILTSSSQMAVDFAFANEFLGVCFHSEPLLRDPNAFYLAAKNYLVSFVWGEDLNDVENIQYFKTIGFDGIIFDRINEYLPGKRNVFLVEKEMARSVSV